MKKIIQFFLDELHKSFKLEKRGFERRRFSLKVVFLIISRRDSKKVSDQHEAIAVDISEHGMCFLVDHLRYEKLHIWKDDSFMEPNFLKLAFYLPGEEDPVDAQAEVVNFSLAGPRFIKRYKIGVAFTKISPSSKEAVLRFLTRVK